MCEKHHCPGRAILRGAPSYNSIDGQVEVSRGHDHAAEEHREEVLRGTGAVLEAASSSTAPPSAIVQSTLEKIGKNVGSHLPSEDALKQRVRRRRRESFPPEPLRRNGIRVPDALRATIEGEGLLLFDTADEEGNDEAEEDTDDGRILCFGTIDNLRKLGQCSMWFLDGTFKTCPRLFRQLYTIHAVIANSCFPLLYAFLPGKSQEVYNTFFREVNAAAVENDIVLNPDFLMADFELSAINALREQFPNARLSCCLFHLGQSVYRCVQRSGLTEVYMHDNNFRISIKELLGLAFLQPEHIEEAFLDLKANLPQEASPVFQYFEDNYVLGRLMGQGKGRPRRVPLRHPPRFPPNIWSIHHLMERGFPRTNNYQEAWHRRFEEVVGRHHLGIYPTIHEIRKEQHRTEHQLVRIEAGEVPRIRRSAREKERERRMNTLFEKFQQGEATREEFLRGIAHNYAIGPRSAHEDEEDGDGNVDFHVALLP